MSIFRSHLFPHLAYLASLAIVCIVGLSRLKQDVSDLKLQGDRLGPAIDLVAPPADDTTLIDFGGPPLDVMEKRIRDCRDFYLSMIANRRQFYSMEGGIDFLETDVLTLRPNLQAVASGIATIQPFVSAMSSSKYSANLKNLNQPLAAALLKFEEGPDLFYEMERIECDRKLEQLQGILIQIRHQALTEMKTATEQLGVKSGSSVGNNAFDRLYRRILYTVIWLIVLSSAYLFAVNTLLARPVQNLAEVARRVTSGRLLSRAKITTGGGPVAELCDDFNRMVDMLVKSLNEQQRSMATLKRRTSELQEANEHKNRFIANISHELKTPLNAVIGFADILMMAHHGDVSEKQLDYLSRIHGAGKHLLAMICDLIDVMKLDLNALQLKLESFDLVEKTLELEKMLMSQVDDKGHNFNCILQEGMPEAVMDPVRYRQIVMNLLSNAIKFTPENGNIELNLSFVGDVFTLSVTDSGIGISKRDQRRIFQDFIQLDSRLHRKHEGTGIGLALTRRLVDLMGGQLTVESTPGKGSVFTVTLPRTYTPPSAEDEKDQKRSFFKKYSSGGNSKKSV